MSAYWGVDCENSMITWTHVFLFCCSYDKAAQHYFFSYSSSTMFSSVSPFCWISSTSSSSNSSSESPSSLPPRFEIFSSNCSIPMVLLALTNHYLYSGLFDSASCTLFLSGYSAIFVLLSSISSISSLSSTSTFSIFWSLSSSIISASLATSIFFSPEAYFSTNSDCGLCTKKL